MSQHKIVQLPEYWSSDTANTFFNDLGFQGWELLRIYNLHAYFMKHDAPIAYKFVKNDHYMADVETTLNTFGYDNWVLILIYNGYSVLKQIQVA